MLHHYIFSRHSFAFATTCLALIPISHAQSAEPLEEPSFVQNSEWSFELSAGVESDSNVSVSELDQNTRSGDTALRLRAEVDFETQLSEQTELKLGYTFSDKSFDEFSNFDLQTHLASATLSHDFDVVKLGLTARYIDAHLGGEGFQSFTQVSPHISGFASKKLFLRGAYTLSDKSFDIQTTRDADVHTLDLDAYYFIDGSKRYVSLGLERETSDAVDSQFSYDGFGFNLRFTQRFDFRGQRARARAGWRFETRDYDGITPSLGTQREDDRNRFQAELELPLNESLFVALDYEYGDFSSNLPSADYDQHVFTARLGVRF